jgi:hypothetical protein
MKHYSVSLTPFGIDLQPLDLRPDASPVEAMAAALHDCPECREALARGEKPRTVTGAELLAAIPRGQRRRMARTIAKAERRAARKAGRGPSPT